MRFRSQGRGDAMNWFSKNLIEVLPAAVYA
jgi:hypothetical protein